MEVTVGDTVTHMVVVIEGQKLPTPGWALRGKIRKALLGIEG